MKALCPHPHYTGRLPIIVKVRSELSLACSAFISKQETKEGLVEIKFDDLIELSEGLCSNSGIDSKRLHTRIMAYEIPCVRDTDCEQADFARADFFSEDLSDARNLMEEGKAGHALLTYMSSVSKGRFDILEDSSYSEMAISPEMTHEGRWLYRQVVTGWPARGL